jgi:transposase
VIDTTLTDLAFPWRAAVQLEKISDDGQGIHVRTRAIAASAICPGCGTASPRVHARYRRRVAELPVGGRRVTIHLQVRRFVCLKTECAQRTFAEQVPGLTARHARKSVALRRQLQTIAVALAGRPGARLAARSAITVSRSTLLRLLRAIQAPEAQAGPRVLGVDDFALRRGHVYATILIDMDTHRPIDVLAGRTAEAFAAWLRTHPGVQVICRDRGGAYAEGARTGAPEAVQVADRYHLWANLGAAVEKTVWAHRGCLAEPTPQSEVADTVVPAPDRTLDVDGQPRALVARKQQRHAAIQQLRAQGHSLTAISRQLGVCFRTVQRYAAANLDDLLAPAIHRSSVLDDYADYIHQRRGEGLTDAAMLHAELRTRGWLGSLRTVQRYLRPLRPKTTAPRPAPAPKPRRVTTWIMTKPEHLDTEHSATLTGVLARCPELRAVRRHVAAFATMMRELGGELLTSWMHAVETDDLPALHTLVTGLRRDHAAVTAGLTLPYSSGAVEGQVNRIKALKRAMYGRANLDLLRQRILIRD